MAFVYRHWTGRLPKVGCRVAMVWRGRGPEALREETIDRTSTGRHPLPGGRSGPDAGAQQVVVVMAQCLDRGGLGEVVFQVCTLEFLGLQGVSPRDTFT